MQANRFSRNRLSALFGLVFAVVLLPLSSAWAGGNEATDVVAPYGHFDMAAGTASGPLTTHYLISNTTSSVSSLVNIKCFNDQSQRVGPQAGTTITLDPFAMEVWSPISLGLTDDPLNTGLGFCYFASTGGSPGDIAVSFLVGVSELNNLITTNDSVWIMADTAQSNVSDDGANIPYWTQQGAWDTFVLVVGPTALGADIDMNVYDKDGNLMGRWGAPPDTGSPGLAPRDLDMTSIAAAVPAAAGGFGHADLDAGSAPVDFGYMGWIVGVNNVSLQAFMYPIPLDADDTGALFSDDRP
jgi:hypothetical protein